jgi:hypothetical protein
MVQMLRKGYSRSIMAAGPGVSGSQITYDPTMICYGVLKNRAAFDADGASKRAS